MEDKSIIADKLDDLEELLLPRRRTLLTWWLKIFSYFFLFAGVVALALYPLMFLMGNDYHVSLYGLESSDKRSFITLAVVVLFVLKGAASYGLLQEKDWAIEVGLVDAAVGILVCLFVGLYTMFGTGSYIASFRLELILLVIYLIKLLKMQAIWKKSPAGYK
ncbi:hypothetical protein L3C95_00410 [Chitinophaga filiformis]|uniref:hypothetical protein n=1 Tax=Chitinophaga filiformis TaxID=104663 RepID=UPI001F19736B|nr:hypothetical protein [Chitinophaga filiformis]MCF6401314.1 hypothetical protein [Chitinophaga filiformis]